MMSKTATRQMSSGIIVVMPAYNAAKTLERTYNDLPHSQLEEVILVDDGSEDETVRIAKELDLKVFVHDHNLGYGASQKTCYREALRNRAMIIVMIHPDYQYDPTLLPKIVRPIEHGEADVVLGSRMLGPPAYQQGMPRWKYLASTFLTALENRVFSLNLSEFHTGYRAYHRDVLEHINFDSNSDGFIFDQEIIAQIVASGFRITEVSVPVRYFPEASSIGSWDATKYGVGVLWLLLQYSLHKAGMRKSTKSFTKAGAGNSQSRNPLMRRQTLE